MEWTREGLRSAGFTGFMRFSDLHSADVPRGPGVYVVLRSGLCEPAFLPTSPAGWINNRDPSVSVETLRANWVSNSEVLYIGKASWGGTGRRGIRKRLEEYRQFGLGAKVRHSGGRLIWQLADSADVLLCWKPVDESLDPRVVEKEMLSDFRRQFGSLPFANLVS